MSIPQHEHWNELLEEATRDPLPLWTRFGAATLPDTLFPRDYHTNPILVYFSRRRRWKETLEPSFVILACYPFIYPLCLALPSFTMAFNALGLALVFSTLALPLLAAFHARGFLRRRLGHVPFQELALTRLTPAEIAQALAIPPLADTRASVIIGIASFAISTAALTSVSPMGGVELAILIWGAVMSLVFLILHARMSLFAGIVAVHVALTHASWTDTLRRVSWHMATLLVGLVLIVILSYTCFCLAILAVMVYGFVLREKTADVATELWSDPDEWSVYKDEG